jgi:hypothetical protein
MHTTELHSTRAHADKEDYIAYMRSNGVYGGEVETQAIADLYNKVIAMHQIGADRMKIIYYPGRVKQK